MKSKHKKQIQCSSLEVLSKELYKSNPDDQVVAVGTSHDSFPLPNSLPSASSFRAIHREEGLLVWSVDEE